MDSRTTFDTYTARNRRQTFREVPCPPSTPFTSAALKAAPAPRPENPPAPFGDLSQAEVVDLCGMALDILPGQSGSSAEQRRAGIRMLFHHLATLPGTTWQERWEASGFNDVNAPSVTVLGRPEVRYHSSCLASALKMAFALRIIQPSVPGFRANTFTDYAEPFRIIQNDPRLDEFFAMVDAQSHLHLVHRRRAKFDLTCALTTQGIALEHLTPSALLHYALENKRLGLTPGATNNTTRFAALAAWEILHRMGHFPPGTAPTLRTFIYNGQSTVEELVDRYRIRNAGVRQLLIDYLIRRRADSDYITIEALSRNLASLFWATVERINPSQQDLALSSEVYDQWRAELQYQQRDRTKLRKGAASILLAVRGLYVDLHSWAITEPERWAQWVAPCPIMPRDLKGFGKRSREINRRMANRTRVRQPLLPVLVQHVEARYEHLASLLEAATPVPLGSPSCTRDAATAVPTPGMTGAGQPSSPTRLFGSSTTSPARPFT
ncbi:hypothetical protein ACGFZQ_49760 [Streptomyces sp. NPDC048254]|uniref:hypothetical protein n=1 Tax=Streptomyces sp. NPDC048254 TaxID=3365525 RepID=UPI003712D8B4